MGRFCSLETNWPNLGGPDLESRIQFWPKLSMAFQCHKIKLLCKFLVEAVYLPDNREQQNLKFGPFSPTPNKLTNFFRADLESRIQFWPKLCMTLQCHKIKLLWRFFSSGNLLFRGKKAIKSEIWTLFAHWKQIDQFLLSLFGKQDSILALQCHKIKLLSISWLRQFTLQTKESNKIWNLDPFCPLETNLPIFFGLFG